MGLEQLSNTHGPDKAQEGETLEHLAAVQNILCVCLHRTFKRAACMFVAKAGTAIMIKIL